MPPPTHTHNFSFGLSFFCHMFRSYIYHVLQFQNSTRGLFMNIFGLLKVFLAFSRSPDFLNVTKFTQACFHTKNLTPNECSMPLLNTSILYIFQDQTFLLPQCHPISLISSITHIFNKLPKIFI